ncbi:HNH endonuclease [Oryzobacter sp. R7]|uniref:HNH endonuclease n=1 Tax=Oryzobacter faecalis TaxID=3388656 RepID=UPI00398CDD1C
MVTGGLGLAERRSRIRAAHEALDALGEVLHEAAGPELAELLGQVDAVASSAEAARVAVTLEALVRGEVLGGATGRVGTAAVIEWLREHAPATRQGTAAAAAKVALLAAGGDGAGSLAPDAPLVDPDTAEGRIAHAVLAGEMSPSVGVAALGEVERLRPRLRPEALPSVADGLVELGRGHGVGVLRRLRPALLARYGMPGELDAVQQRLAGSARLSAPLVASTDLTEYQLRMTPEQAVALEAAIGPLSAPAPNDATGARDLRPAGQRRVEALTEVCRRSSGLDADTTGPDGTGGAAAAVHLTIALDDLVEGTGCGEVLGSTATGTVLSVETLRRICCEADLIPHVLGTAGEVLDLGRVARLFSRAQRRALARRDRCCTYPGCAAPAAWTRAHHALHWLDGGATDLDNAALLCERHHQVVHRRRLWATVRARPDTRGRYVVWDLTEGSYDRHLEQIARERSAHDPPPITPTRLAELAAALTGDDDLESRVAEHDLALWNEWFTDAAGEQDLDDARAPWRKETPAA